MRNIPLLTVLLVLTLIVSAGPVSAETAYVKREADGEGLCSDVYPGSYDPVSHTYTISGCYYTIPEDEGGRRSVTVTITAPQDAGERGDGLESLTVNGIPYTGEDLPDFDQTAPGGFSWSFTALPTGRTLYMRIEWEPGCVELLTIQYEDPVTLELAPEDAIIGGEIDLQGVIGERGSPPDEVYEWSVGYDTDGDYKIDGSPVAFGTTANGIIRTYVNLPHGLKNTYDVLVTVSKMSDPTLCCTRSIPVSWKIDIESSGDFRTGGSAGFSGRITDAPGRPVTDARVELWAQDQEPAGIPLAFCRISSSGHFVLSTGFADAGPYCLYLVFDQTAGGEAIPLRTFEVLPAELTVDVSPSTIIGLSTQAYDPVVTITAEVNGRPQKDIAITIKDRYGRVIKRLTTDSEGRSTYTWSSSDGFGLFTVGAEYEDGTTPDHPDYTGEASFKVVRSQKLNVFVSPETTIPGDTSVFISILDKNGSGIVEDGDSGEITQVVFDITGPFSGEKSFDSRKDPFVDIPKSQVQFDLNIEQPGEIIISGTATFGDGSTREFVKVLQVDGFCVKASRDLGTVGDTVDLWATVRDASGAPVNNALVVFKHPDGGGFLTANESGEYIHPADKAVIDGRKTNIINGYYHTTAKLAKAGPVEITVLQADEVKARITGHISSIPAYTIKANLSEMVATLRYDLEVMVVDADGNTVVDIEQLEITGGGLPAPLTTADAILLDSDQDGVPDTYRFQDLTARAVNDFTIQATTHGGNREGTLTIPVYPPSLKIIPDDGVVTDSMEETVALTVLDTDEFGEPIPAVIELKLEGLLAADDYSYYCWGRTEIHSEDFDEGTLTVRDATSASFSTKPVIDQDSPEVPQIIILLSYTPDIDPVRAGRVLVKPPIVNIDKEEVMVGFPSTLNITVSDAHGNPLPNTPVNLYGATYVFANTDDSGRAELTINPYMSGEISIVVGNSVAGQIKAVHDTTGPEINLTIPSIVHDDELTLTGTISDSTMVQRIYVNDELLFVNPEQKIDLSELDITIPLSEGRNIIKVSAVDANGNGTNREVEVIQQMAKRIHLVLDDPCVEVNGEVQNTDQPPVALGGRTLVPLRFIAEALGGTAFWDSPFATITVNGMALKISCDQSVQPWAVVNDAGLEIDVPGQIMNGRAMVPARLIGEAFGADVVYRSGDRSIEITF